MLISFKTNILPVKNVKAYMYREMNNVSVKYDSEKNYMN